jgi:iron(III) transport system ATP-binding protein
LRGQRYQNKPDLQIIRNTISMLTFRDIHHAYDAPVLTGIDLDVTRASILALFGPSGCGKSTLLSLAAGLLPLQRGEIALDGRVLVSPLMRTPPERLPVGLVFQTGALFPHMTIAQNVSFGFRSGENSKKRVHHWLSMAGIEGTAKRMPHELSGGQQQRAALVRALASEPEILLLDEPLANIDITLRRALREQIRQLIQSTGTTAIFVTHDPEEALELADEIAVLEHGKIIQKAETEAFSESPANASIANTLGGYQIFDAVLTETGLDTAFGKWPLDVLRAPAQHRWGPVQLGVRADALTVQADDKGSLILAESRPVFGVTRYRVTPKPGSPGPDALATAPGRPGLERGAGVSLIARPSSVLLFSPHFHP